MRTYKMKILSLLAGAVFVSSTVSAQEFVYTPNNPSFGGNPFNSSHLLGVANSQNGFEAPEDPEDVETQSEIFLRQLESRLFAGLASQVTDAIFGENPQESGEIVFGDQAISFVRGLDSVTITIFDAVTGTTTEIVLPLFAAG